jgi:hypothetical protein
MTPVFRERTSWAPIFVVVRIAGGGISVCLPQVSPELASLQAGQDSMFSIRNWLKGSEGHVTGGKDGTD